MSPEIFLVLGITGHFPMILALLHRHSHSSERFLDSFPHTILTGIVTTTLATARNDEKRKESFFRNTIIFLMTLSS